MGLPIAAGLASSGDNPKGGLPPRNFEEGIVKVIVLSLSGNELLRESFSEKTPVGKICQLLENAAGPKRTARILFGKHELHKMGSFCRQYLRDKRWSIRKSRVQKTALMSSSHGMSQRGPEIQHTG